MPHTSRHEKRRQPSRFNQAENDKLQIDNPLIHKDLTTVKSEALEIAMMVNKTHPDTELFTIAAEIARDPPNFSKVQNLSPAQRSALEREKELGIFKQPKAFNVTMALLCLSALTQGWIESTSNVANLTWPSSMNLLDENNELDKRGKWIFAATSSAPFLSGAVSALLFVDSRLLLGRRGVILLSSILCFAGAVAAAVAGDWVTLLAARLVLGVGMGAKASVTAIFAAEISPSHLRGRTVMSWQLFVALGVACGFLSAAVVTYIRPEQETWRWQTATLLLPLMGLLSLSWVVSESPRYYIKKSNLHEAFKTLCDLREDPLLAARDLVYINAQIQVELDILPKIQDDIEPAQSDEQRDEQSDAGRDLLMLQERIKNLSYGTRLRQVFVDPRTRRATVSAIVVMLSQQLCGINSVMFYSSNFLRFDGGDLIGSNDSPEASSLAGKTPYWLNFGIGAVNFVFTFPAFFLIDKKGRRWLLLVMAPFMTLCMLGASLSFRSHDPHVRAALAITFIYLFVVFYSMGQGPVAFTYSSEVFPLVYREVGFGLAVSANFLGAGLLGLLVPHAQLTGETSFPRPADDNEAQTILLGTFAALNLIAFLLMFGLVRETAGFVVKSRQGKINSMSLEELNYLFGVGTRQHLRYCVNPMLPWRVRMLKWMFLRIFMKVDKPEKPPVVWQWAKAKDDNTSGEDSEGPKHSGARAVELEDLGSVSPSRSRERLSRDARSRPRVRHRASRDSGSTTQS